MATEEQEAFIDEMMHKKPREIWQELWDARQRLAELTANVNPFGWRSTYKEPNYPEGDWMPLPVDGTDVPHEFMQDERGTCWIRPVKETGANPFWFVDLLGPERRGGLKYVDTAKTESLVKEEGSLKGLRISQAIVDEVTHFDIDYLPEVPHD